MSFLFSWGSGCVVLGDKVKALYNNSAGRYGAFNGEVIYIFFWEGGGNKKL